MKASMFVIPFAGYCHTATSSFCGPHTKVTRAVVEVRGQAGAQPPAPN